MQLIAPLVYCDAPEGTMESHRPQSPHALPLFLIKLPRVEGKMLPRGYTVSVVVFLQTCASRWWWRQKTILRRIANLAFDFDSQNGKLISINDT